MAPRRKKLPRTVNTVQRPRAYYQYRYGTVQRALKSAWERAGKKPKWAVFVASSVAGHIRTTTERECDHQWNSDILEPEFYPNGRPNPENIGHSDNGSTAPTARGDN